LYYATVLLAGRTAIAQGESVLGCEKRTLTRFIAVTVIEALSAFRMGVSCGQTAASREAMMPPTLTREEAMLEDAG
jgi:hypothetical protein